MSKYASLPGYDVTSPVEYGDDENISSLPEVDRDWKEAPEENVEIISCSAAQGASHTNVILTNVIY